MPLIKKQETGTSGLLGVWKISEQRQELEHLLLSGDKKQISSVPHPEKWREKAAARILLRELLGEAGIPAGRMIYDIHGKPYIEGQNVHLSISHTAGFAAAIIDTDHPVGIDIETPKTKMLTVCKRILSDAELADINKDPEKAVFYWCCKEVLYKIHGAGNLDFQKQLFIHPFQPSNIFNCTGEIRFLTGSCSHTLRCMWINKLALVYNLL